METIPTPLLFKVSDYLVGIPTIEINLTCEFKQKIDVEFTLKQTYQTIYYSLHIPISNFSRTCSDEEKIRQKFTIELIRKLDSFIKDIKNNCTNGELQKDLNIIFQKSGKNHPARFAIEQSKRKKLPRIKRSYGDIFSLQETRFHPVMETEMTCYINCNEGIKQKFIGLFIKIRNILLKKIIDNKSEMFIIWHELSKYLDDDYYLFSPKSESIYISRNRNRKRKRTN